MKEEIGFIFSDEFAKFRYISKYVGMGMYVYMYIIYIYVCMYKSINAQTTTEPILNFRLVNELCGKNCMNNRKCVNDDSINKQADCVTVVLFLLLFFGIFFSH